MMVLHILVMMISTLNGSNIKTGTCLGLAGASTLAEVPLFVPEMVKWGFNSGRGTTFCTRNGESVSEQCIQKHL